VVATFFIYIALDVTRVVKWSQQLWHAVARIFQQSAATTVADGRDSATSTKILTEGESLSQLHRPDSESEIPKKSQQGMAQVQDPKVEQLSIDLSALRKVDQQSSLLPADHSQLRTPRQLEEGRNNKSHMHSNIPLKKRYNRPGPKENRAKVNLFQEI